MAKKLTAKQQRFVEEYLVDLNATQAAIRAGYSEKTAYSIGNENLSKPEIANAIQSHMDTRSQETKIDANYVLNGIKRLADMCSGEIPTPRTITDEDGNQVVVHEIVVNQAGANKAYENLGRHLKLFTDVKEHGIEQNLAERLAKLSDL